MDSRLRNDNAGHAGFLNKQLSEGAFAQERRVADVT